MIVKAKLKCKKCKHEEEYFSSEIEFDHVICKKCGAKIGVIKYLNAVNPDYKKIGNTVYRRDPKVRMSKRERRRMRNEYKIIRRGKSIKSITTEAGQRIKEEKTAGN